MIDLSLIYLFVPTFIFVSATPGMCMTLAMTMGMTLGVKRAMWMMAGELAGVALVAMSAVLGVAALMLNYPEVFALFKLVGGAYLVYLGLQMWRSRGKMAVTAESLSVTQTNRKALLIQGFMTAIANPKGWAFFVSLLPPFLDSSKAILPQLSILVSIILVIEFSCLMAYAAGGRSLGRFLEKSGNVNLLNRLAGTMMIFVGLWLAFG